MNPEYLYDHEDDDERAATEAALEQLDSALDQQAIVALFDATEAGVDILLNRYGGLWSVRPISERAVDWVREYCDGDPGEQPFGIWNLVVEQDEVVDLFDEAHASGLTVR